MLFVWFKTNITTWKKHEQWINTVWFRYSLNLIYITAAMYLSAGWILQQPIRLVTYRIFKYANDVISTVQLFAPSRTHIFTLSALQFTSPLIPLLWSKYLKFCLRSIRLSSLSTVPMYCSVCLRFPTTTVSMSMEHNHYIIHTSINICVVYILF